MDRRTFLSGLLGAVFGGIAVSDLDDSKDVPPRNEFESLRTEQLNNAEIVTSGRSVHDATDTAGPGGTVRLPGGTYELSEVLGTYDDLTIEGTGRGARLKCADDTQINLIDASGVKGLTLKNLKLDGNKANNTDGGDDTTQNGLYIDGVTEFSGIENVWFENFVNRGAYLAGMHINSGGERGITIENSYFLNNGSGAYFGSGGEYCRFEGCHFEGNQLGVDGLAGNNTFVGCSFTDNSQNGVQLTSGSNDGKTTFSACKFNHNGGTAVFLEEVPMVSLVNCDILANKQHGVALKGAHECKIADCTFGANSQASSGTYNDVALAGNANETNQHNQIKDNTFNNYTGSMTTAVEELHSDVDANVIKDNVLIDCSISTQGTNTVASGNDSV